MTCINNTEQSAVEVSRGTSPVLRVLCASVWSLRVMFHVCTTTWQRSHADNAVYRLTDVNSTIDLTAEMSVKVILRISLERRKLGASLP